MDDSKFIYAFSDNAKDYLVSLGHHLIKGDELKCIYIFDNSIGFNRNALLNFSMSDFVLSNVLTF